MFVAGEVNDVLLYDVKITLGFWSLFKYVSF